MNIPRRRFLWLAGAGAVVACTLPITPAADASTGSSTDHERFMRLAIEQARRNADWPFGVVIVETRTGELLAAGVNTGADNPTYHGEIVAMNDYVRGHGNRGWADTTLYTTGEPCAMCMSAIAWAGLPQVVWGSSIEDIACTGVGQINLSANEVASAAKSFYTPTLLLGGVLADETNRLFREAQQVRQDNAPTSDTCP